jgi:hypothetical protein
LSKKASFVEVMRRWNASALAFVLAKKNPLSHGPFAGTISAIEARSWAIPAASGGGSNHHAEATGGECSDKARDHVGVMLHLRVRYVSKAAILTVPAPLVSAENRSPA